MDFDQICLVILLITTVIYDALRLLIEWTKVKKNVRQRV